MLYYHSKVDHDDLKIYAISPRAATKITKQRPNRPTENIKNWILENIQSEENMKRLKMEQRKDTQKTNRKKIDLKLTI